MLPYEATNGRRLVLGARIRRNRARRNEQETVASRFGRPIGYTTATPSFLYGRKLTAGVSRCAHAPLYTVQFPEGLFYPPSFFASAAESSRLRLLLGRVRPNAAPRPHSA